MSEEHQWAWAGVVFQDVQGNFVAWQVDRPRGQIQQQMYPIERLRLDLAGPIRKWTGMWPGPESRVIQGIAQYPPLPLDSGE